jgi:hypothetical protein
MYWYVHARTPMLAMVYPNHFIEHRNITPL